MRDEHYSPFRRLPLPERPLDALVFVMARLHRDRTDSMRGSLRAGPHGPDAVYTPYSELYRSQWFAAEELALADLATQQEALAAAGWTTVPFQP